MTAVWTFPTRILFGTGTVAQAGLEAKSLGAERALVVTDAGVRSTGLVDAVTEALGKADVDPEVFDGVSENPLEREVLAAVDAYKKTRAQLVVAVGGGSPLDLGKLVRLGAIHAPPLAQYDEAAGGTAKITGDVPPMIAIPTTAGTGSEVAPNTVLTVEKTNKKTNVSSPKLIPNVALLDPDLTAGLPPRWTAATGFGALSQSIEAYCATADHPMADAVALAGIELVATSLEKAVQDGKDLTARGNMLKAATMSAVASHKGPGACRSLAHPLCAEAGLHHGLADALCLPAVMDFNRGAVADRIARVGRLLGVRGDDEETQCFECSGAVRALRRKVGLPEGLAAAGIDESMLPDLAPLAMEDPAHRNNPRPCEQDDMLALYKASM